MAITAFSGRSHSSVKRFTNLCKCAISFHTLRTRRILFTENTPLPFGAFRISSCSTKTSIASIWATNHFSNLANRIFVRQKTNLNVSPGRANHGLPSISCLFRTSSHNSHGQPSVQGVGFKPMTSIFLELLRL